MELNAEQVNERAKKVRLLLMDCDGVLTDGRLYFSPNGEELKVFHVRDGHGIVTWHEAGFPSGIISGRTSEPLQMRAKQLGIKYVFLKRKDKLVAFNEVIADSGLTAAEVAYIGDDTPDIEVMQVVGLSVAVNDAMDDVKNAAHYVTKMAGGRGAVREIIDLLLKSRE
jgi:3-deoxy-D-manno-octulosonate 8-phosphate phosphatase (KDO 8-P phosphatase)